VESFALTVHMCGDLRERRDDNILQISVALWAHLEGTLLI